MRVLKAVVVNYRTPHDLERFVYSLLKNYPKKWELELLVQDVDPTEESARAVDAIFSRIKMKHPFYVNRIPWNCGYGHAINTGMDVLHSKGENDVLLALNADVEVIEGDSLDMCCEALMSNPEWGILGPRQIDKAGRITHGGITGTASDKKIRGWKAFDGFRGVDDTMASVSGSIYFVKGRLWDELSDCYQTQSGVGAFLETPHYYEETFCSDHAKAHGHKVVYFGETTFVHKWHQASPVGGPMDKQLATSRSMYREACESLGIEHE